MSVPPFCENCLTWFDPEERWGFGESGYLNCESCRTEYETGIRP